MKTVLVLATGAKFGGALTILNKFVFESRKLNNRYIILSPIRPLHMTSNMIWVEKNTVGVGTLLFTTILSFFYILKFKPDIVLSFSNYNSIFSLFCQRVTYFHQYLIFDDVSIKFKIIRFVLRYLFQRDVLYVVQTGLVKHRLANLVKAPRGILVRWPGYLKVTVPIINISIDQLITHIDGKRILVFPCTSILDKHKNFELLASLDNVFHQNNCVILVTCNEKLNEGLKAIRSIGRLAHDEYLYLLQRAEGVVITSLQETVCLPLIETHAAGKRAFVLERPYILDILNRFEELPFLRVFSNSCELDCLLKAEIDCKKINFEFIEGEWDLDV